MEGRKSLNKKNDPQNNLDDLIDLALRSYTPSAPRPGLENRILARLDSESALHPSWFSWWKIGAVATAVATVLLLFLLRLPKQLTPQNIATVQREMPSQLISAPKVTQTKPAAQARFSPVGRRRSSATARREAWFAYLRICGPQSSTRWSENSNEPIEIKPIGNDPIVIEPIKINPLEDNSAETGDTL